MQTPPKPDRKERERLEDRTPAPQDEPPLTPEEARRQLGFPMLPNTYEVERE